MYQAVYHDRKHDLIHLWDDKDGKIEIPASAARYAYRKKAGGKYRSLNGDEMEKVTRFSPKDPSLYESDVPYTTRILIDAYEDDDEPSIGHRTVFIDIEVDTEDGFPNIKEGDKAITAIAIYDDLSSQYTAFILDKKGQLQDITKDNVTIISVQSEKDLIRKFLTKWEEIQPTIVTGWNIDYFDMPYLYYRISGILGRTMASKLSPIGICYINDFNDKLVVAGVNILDYMGLYKKFIGRNEPSYALGAIGKRVVNMDKITYKGNLNTLYNEDINKYVEYNLNDVKIVVALDKKLQYIDLCRLICHKGHVPYESYSMSSKYIEGAMLIYLRRLGMIAYNKSVTGKEDYERQVQEGEEGFVGAYVKDPVPGRYEWVYDLDLTSMYPSIIISLNISPETIAGMVENWSVEKYFSGELTELYIDGKQHTKEEFEKLLKENNYSIASNGMLYRQDKKGIVPSILIDWFEERKKYRKLAKEYGDKKEWDKYEFNDRRQQIYKVLLNSVYGTLGLPVFRFYNKDNAAAVTVTGQDIIKSTGNVVNQYYAKLLGKRLKVTDTTGKLIEYTYENQVGTSPVYDKAVEITEVPHDDYVIYQDTDSSFSSALPIVKALRPEIDTNNDEQMSKVIIEVASEVQKYINNFYNVLAKRAFNIETHRFDIKQEVIAKSSFWLVKKRYCQFIINKGGVACDELEVKGMDIVRTSFPFKFREFMKEVVISILNKTDKNIIDESILKLEKDLKTFNIIDIAKNTSVKFISLDKESNYDPVGRTPFQYVTRTPAQVKASLAYNDLLKLWELDKKHQVILNGQKIKWVYLKDNIYNIEAIAMKADDTDPDKIIEFIEEHVDRRAMYEHELKSKLIDFYEVLKWEYPTLAKKSAQKFFDF